MHHTVSIIPHLNAEASRQLVKKKVKGKAPGNLQSPSRLRPSLGLNSQQWFFTSTKQRGCDAAGGRKRDSPRETKWVQSEFLQVFRRCWVGAAAAIWSLNVILKCFHICVSMQVQLSHFMLSKWPVTVTRRYCFINRVQTTAAPLEMQRTISSLE